MGKLILLSLLFFNLLFSCAYAQRCDSYNYHQKYPVTTSTSFRITETGKVSRDTIANEVVTIPVVIHVLYNTDAQNISDAQILSQLTALNNDYRKLNADAANIPAAFASVAGDARITFCLAKIDNSGKATTGIIRKHTAVQSWTADDGMKYSAQGGDNAWDSKRYLNIWVCNLFGRSLGYSSLPGSQADKDGLVIQYDVFGITGKVSAPFNKGRTATHEIGHWLGLKHIWADANCGDDGIADTPPQQNYNNGCPSFPHVSSCSINGNGDMFMDFMDLTDDACMYMFTKGQAVKMRSQFAIGGARNTFLASTVCDGNAVQRGALPIDSSAIKTSISIFPNPAIKFITIEGSSKNNLVGKTAKVSNAYGAIVIMQTLTSQKNTISVEKLLPGVYFVRMASLSGIEQQILRFVKE